MLERTAIAAAAEQIIALINSRPQTPSHSEIAKIIADFGMTSASAPAQRSRVAELRKMGDEIRALLDADEDEGIKLDGEFMRICKAIYVRPPRTLVDLQERAEIARHWHAHQPDDSQLGESCRL